MAENEEVKFTVTEVTGTEKPKAVLEAELIEKHAQEQTPAEIAAPVDTPVEISDEQLFERLSKKLGKPVTSYDELLKEKDFIKEELPEDVATFLKYKKETGRGLDDFTKLNRDFKAMNPNDKLFEYLSLKEEGLDKEDILSMIEEYKPVEINDEFDTEEDITNKKAANQKKARDMKKTLNEADKFFEKQKETYKVPLVSSPVSIPDEEKEEFESYKQYIQKAKSENDVNVKRGEWFDQKTKEVFSNEFKGFEFKVKVGEEEKALTFSPGTADELKSLQATPMNFINKFMDENGMMTDAKGYHKGLAVAMNPEKFAQFFIDQGYAMAVENNDRTTKNINMSVRNTPAPLATNGFKVQEVKPPNPNFVQQPTFGSRLTVKKV